MVRELSEFEIKLRKMRSNQDKNNPSGMLKFKKEIRKNLAKKPKGNKI